MNNLYDVLIGVLHVSVTGKVETILGDRLNNLRVYVQLYLWDHKLQLNILTQGSAFVSLVLDRFSVLDWDRLDFNLGFLCVTK